MEFFFFIYCCDFFHSLVTQFFTVAQGDSASVVAMKEAMQNAYVYKDFYWLYLVISGVCFAICYGLHAAALYKIAKNNGFKNKWMAFVPVLSTYYAGVLSRRNRVYNIDPKVLGIVTAVIEGLYLLVCIFGTTSEFILFSGGYAYPEYKTQILGGYVYQLLIGYRFVGVPAELVWTRNVYNLTNTVWADLLLFALVICWTLLYICFFQTYAPEHYFGYSLLSVLCFRGPVMFAARGGKAVSYRDYIIDLQRQRYQQYQQYVRGNFGDGYANNSQGMPRSGGGDASDDPFSEYSGHSADNSEENDPFDGLGKQ